MAINSGLKAYQAMQKAAKAVEDNKPGARVKLKAAAKKYTDLVAKNAKKDAEDKIKAAKTKAAKISGVKAKPKTKTAAAKKKTTTAKKTAGRKVTRKTAAKRRR